MRLGISYFSYVGVMWWRSADVWAGLPGPGFAAVQMSAAPSPRLYIPPPTPFPPGSTSRLPDTFPFPMLVANFKGYMT